MVSVQARLDNFDTLTFKDFVLLRHDLEILIENDPEFAKFAAAQTVLESIDKVIKLDQNIHQLHIVFERGLKKIYKRVEREAIDQIPVPEHLCTRCNRRPRKFNDLCGPCAEELGVRPHGKV